MSRFTGILGSIGISGSTGISEISDRISGHLYTEFQNQFFSFAVVCRFIL